MCVFGVALFSIPIGFLFDAFSAVLEGEGGDDDDDEDEDDDEGGEAEGDDN